MKKFNQLLQKLSRSKNKWDIFTDVSDSISREEEKQSGRFQSYIEVFIVFAWKTKVEPLFPLWISCESSRPTDLKETLNHVRFEMRVKRKSENSSPKSKSRSSIVILFDNCSEQFSILISWWFVS